MPYKDLDKKRRCSLKSKLKCLFGLSEPQRALMFADQDGRCAICRKAPATDHDHDYFTDRVRGILCHSCNIGIGLLGDHSDGLQPAFRYLALHDGAFMGAHL